MPSTDYIIQIIGQDKTGKAFQQVQGNVDRARKSVINLKNAILAIGTGVAVRSIINTTARFQDLRTSLTAVTGSAEAGAEAFSFISKFATKTQFGVDDLTETFIKLKSAGITPTESLLTTFTDTAAVTTDQIGSLTAITDLFARSVSGGLGLEDLNRLADRGAPVFKILEEQLGLTRLQVSEFGKTAEGAEEIRKALVKGLNESFGGATAERVNNLSTQMSNFGIAMTNAQDILGQGLAPAFGDITVRLTDFITANEELIKQVGVDLGIALNDAVDLFNLMRKNIETTSVVVIGLVTAFNPIAGAILIALTAVNQFRNGLERTLGIPLRLADVFKGTFEFIKSILTDFINKITNDFKEFINATVSLVNKLPFTEFALPFELAQESTDNATKSLGEYVLAQVEAREEAEKLTKFYKQLKDQLQFQTATGQEDKKEENIVYAKFTKEIIALKDKFRTEEEVIKQERDKQIQMLDDFVAKEKNITFEQLQEIALLKERIATDSNERLKAIEDQRLQDIKDNFNKQKQLLKDRNYADLNLQNLTDEQKKEMAQQTGREVLDELAKRNKVAFAINKAFAIKDAYVNTAQGVTKALGMGPYGIPLAIGIGALGAIEIATIASQQYSGRALGGRVQAGSQYMVGEQGAEMFVPDRSGTIIPNKNLGRSTNVNITINANDTQGFDDLLVKRRSVIVNVINDALNSQGREALV
jgi:hypothetical protein